MKKKEFITVGQETNDFYYTLTTDPDYRIYCSYVSSTTVNCPMDFTKFPFDKHTCRYEVTYFS